MTPEDQYHEAQERQWSLMLAEYGSNDITIISEGVVPFEPPYIIIHAPEYEDNGSGINPEW